MTSWFSLVSSFLVIAACARAQTQEPAAIVVRSPADFAATAGQTVRLTCVAYGSPVPNITWTTNSQDLDLTDKVSYETVAVNETYYRIAILQLCDITSAHAAEYTCAANNGVSGTGIASNSAKTFLSVSQPVTEPPSIVVRPPETNNVDNDDTVEMVCVAYGNPVPSITWSRPGCADLNDTSESTNIKIHSEMITYENTTFQKSVMQICRIKPEDSHPYTCTAKNGIRGIGLASSTATFQVVVNGGQPSSPSPTASDVVRMAETSTFVDDSLAVIIMAVEGVIILILFLVVLIVVGWAYRVKNAKTKSVTLARRVDEDSYAIPPGTSAELKCKEIEGEYAAVDEIGKPSPLSSNPAYDTGLPPMIHMNDAYGNIPSPNEGQVTYEAVESEK